jgi:hypothetical protein
VATLGWPQGRAEAKALSASLSVVWPLAHQGQSPHSLGSRQCPQGAFVGCGKINKQLNGGNSSESPSPDRLAGTERDPKRSHLCEIKPQPVCQESSRRSSHRDRWCLCSVGQSRTFNSSAASAHPAQASGSSRGQRARGRETGPYCAHYGTQPFPALWGQLLTVQAVVRWWADV